MNFGTLAAPTADPAAGGYTGQSPSRCPPPSRRDDSLHHQQQRSHDSSTIYTGPLTWRDDDAEGQGLSPGLHDQRDDDAGLHDHDGDAGISLTSGDYARARR